MAVGFVGSGRGRLFPVLQAPQGLAQEPVRCLGAAGRRQVEIDRVAPLVDCPVQVGPLAPHLDVGFIQAPARIKATPPEPAQPFLHLRGVALDPAIDRRMVDRNAAFRSEEHTSELQSLMRISYAVFCLKKKPQTTYTTQ